jgi:hypothetical protein
VRYAINLNLDYDSHPHATVKGLFRHIRDGLIQAGFRRDGRLFTVEMPGEEACLLARQVVETAAGQAGIDDVTPFIKEFYGFDFDAAVNLLLPDAEEISVEELAEVTDLELIRFKTQT